MSLIELYQGIETASFSGNYSFIRYFYSYPVSSFSGAYGKTSPRGNSFLQGNVIQGGKGAMLFRFVAQFKRITFQLTGDIHIALKHTVQEGVRKVTSLKKIFWREQGWRMTVLRVYNYFYEFSITLQKKSSYFFPKLKTPYFALVLRS